MEKIAFITGINGQDGSYLSELLLEKGYFVYGIIRRMSCINTTRIDPLYSHPQFKVFYGDMTDTMGLQNILQKIAIKHSELERLEVYNLAAQSHVKVSFEVPEYTVQVNAVGTLHLLEILKNLSIPMHKIRFYQACTSEMYGDQEKHQSMNEDTLFNPVSPYSISKQMAYHFVKMYRDGYGMFACNGILFNHESPRRGENFVTRKVVIGVHEIMQGKKEMLEMGNLDSIRDWGHAKDYVRGMWLMLQAETPEDYVLGTGKTYSVRYFIEKVFAAYGKTIVWEGSGVEEIGKDQETGKVYIRIQERYFRPLEVPYLQANYTKAKEKLGWEPSIDLEMLIQDMMQEETKKI
jgi:GDPmannose 4,6-dehydratase